MALVQALLAAIFRSLGKLLNTAFGWATTMFFGKVPQDRQIYLSIIAFGSVIWGVAILGVIFPGFATFLLAFVTLPSWVDRGRVRVAMLVVAVALPLVLGIIALFLHEPSERPAGLTARAKAALRGYPFTLGLAIALVMMTLFAPILKLRALLKRWTTQHVPIVVESQEYRAVVDQIQQTLATGGWEVERRPASWMLRLPTRVMTWLAGGAVSNLVADELTTLRSERLEVALHPADLVISGRERDVVHVRAILAEQLAFSPAYLTWDREAHAIEDRLREIWNGLRAQPRPLDQAEAARRLQAIERDLRKIEVPYEEWETLFRGKLLVERGLLQTAAGLVARPPDLTEASSVQIGAAQVETKRAAPRRLLPRLSGLGLLGLLLWLRLKPRVHE